MKSDKTTTYIKSHLPYLPTVPVPEINSITDLYRIGYSFHLEVQPVELEVIGTIQNSFLIVVLDDAGKVKMLGKFFELRAFMFEQGFTKEQIEAGYLKAAKENRLRVVKAVHSQTYYRTTRIWINYTDDKKAVLLTVQRSEFEGKQHQAETHRGEKYLFIDGRIALFDRKQNLTFQITDLKNTEVIDCVKNDRFRITETDLLITSKA